MQNFQRQHVEAIPNPPWYQQGDLCVSMCFLFSILFLLDPSTSSLQEEMLFVCLFDRHHFFLFRIFSSFSFSLLLLLCLSNIIVSVRSSYNHPDLLLIHHQHPHFFRSHRSSIQDFHFLSHYSYIKGNHWTHMLATCIPYGYNRTSLPDSAR